MNPAPHRPPYSTATNAQHRPLEALPCHCGCGQPVPRGERNEKARYVNDAHRAAAAKRRAQRRSAFDEGIQLGLAGELPGDLRSDDPELRELVELGYADGKKRRESLKAIKVRA